MPDFLKSIEACINGKLDEDTCDKIFLQTGIMAELDAILLYQTIAEKTNNVRIRQIMLDVAREEKTHAGEFQYLLRKIDKEFDNELKKGQKEVEDK